MSSSFAEASGRITSVAYDIVLTSSELPDGNHLDVLNLVRKQPEMVLTPVLLLQGGRPGGGVQNALDKGFTEVFFKRDMSDLTHYLNEFWKVSRDGGESNSMRALVLEDDRLLGALYREMLLQHGFEVDFVPSGEAALAQAERLAYDFVIVDLVLSGSCSGMNFLRRLRLPHMASAQAVAVAISAYTDESRRIESLHAGANAFIQKPVRERELDAHIKALVQRAGGPAQKESLCAETGESVCRRCIPCQLTPREINICSLVLAGYADKRIADEMGVSYWTVRTHIAHAFRKCDVSNRVELIRRMQGA